MGVGLAVVAAVFGVLAVGWIGIAVLLAVLLVLFVAELWRESARLTGLLSAMTENRDGLVQESQLMRLEVASLRERAESAETLGEEVTHLREQLSELQEDPRVTTFEQLLEGLTTQLRLIDLVQKHRSLRREGSVEWPVVRLALQQDATVLARAYVGDDAERLTSEWITLVEPSTDAAFTRAQVDTAGDRELFVSFGLDELPEELQNELLDRGSIAPNGLAARLAGLTLGSLSAIEDHRLDELRSALIAVMEALQSALTTRPDELAEESER